MRPILNLFYESNTLLSSIYPKLPKLPNIAKIGPGRRSASMLGISRDEYCGRLERVRELIARAGLDALIAYANKTHPGHVRYLSGYEPRLGIHDSAVCLVTPKHAALLTNASFDRPETLTWLEEVMVTSDYAAAM